MLPEFLRPYAKLVVAVVGFVVIIGMNRFGVQNADIQSLLVGLVRDSLLGALASWGVYQVANAPLPPKKD